MQEEQGHDSGNTRRETEYERLHRQLYQVPEELSVSGVAAEGRLRGRERETAVLPRDMLCTFNAR
jgi:hypothetical protein